MRILGLIPARGGSKGIPRKNLAPFAGKPLIEDQIGPFGTPITDSERVKVGSATDDVLLVAYLPVGYGGSRSVNRALAKILDRAPVAVPHE